MRTSIIAAIVLAIVLTAVYLATQPTEPSREPGQVGHPTPDEIRNLRIN